MSISDKLKSDIIAALWTAPLDRVVTLVDEYDPGMYAEHGGFEVWSRDVHPRDVREEAEEFVHELLEVLEDDEPVVGEVDTQSTAIDILGQLRGKP